MIAHSSEWVFITEEEENMVTTYKLSDGDVQLSDNFSLHEFQSGDGEDEILVSDILINYLEQLKTALNADSLVINSGYRTPDFSVSVGGGRNDAHTKGIASDVYAYRDNALISGAELCCKAQDIGFGGIGYMGNAIHVDVRNEEDYANSHWWGDENEGCNVSDWYDYFGMEKESEQESEPMEDTPEPIEESADGWCIENGDWKYYKNGNLVTEDWIYYKDSWYYLDENGILVAGAWVKNASGTWSYCDEEGKAVAGRWAEINGKWYSFDDNAVMRTDEWVNDYFVGNEGYMLTNTWVGHNNMYYWVGEDGKWLDKETWKSDTTPDDGYAIYEY